MTPLLAGWEFWQKPGLSADKAELMTLAKTQDWSLSKSVRDELEKDIWAIVITDSDQNIQYVNTRFEEMTGYLRQEIIGHRPTVLQGALTSLKSRLRIRQAVTQQKSVRERLLNYRKDQSVYWCHVVIKPVFNRQKELVSYIAFEQEMPVK
ncbi:PAS domain-containing protein [Spirosoma flavus]